jgi:hypothetical protein
VKKNNNNNNNSKNKDDKNNHHIAGRPYYDNENKTGLCPVCVKVWELHEQVMYTTKNKTMTYGICPECLIKHPLRKKPRTRTGFIERFPPKRID